MSDSRSGLLGAISGFSKGSLKKTGLGSAFDEEKKVVEPERVKGPSELTFDSDKNKVIPAFWNHKESSDGVIKNGDKEYYVHKSYVGMWSKVLGEAFAKDSTITITEDVPLFENVLSYFYLQTIKIPATDFLKILRIAVKYKVEPLVAEISKQAEDVISIDTCCSLLQQAMADDELSSKALIDKCLEMVCHQFDEVCGSDDFSKLDISVLKGILSKDELGAEEAEVFEAVKKWILHDEENRTKYSEDLLSLIRFPTMDGVKLSLLDEDPFFARSKVLPKLWLEALKYHANEDSIEKSDKEEDKKRFQFRWYSPLDQTFAYDPAHKIKEFVINSNGWYRIWTYGAKALDGAYKKGGRGAIIAGTFFLKRGDKLLYLVGGMSKKRSNDTGGGGGTFVALNTSSVPLIVAGGGGGTRGSSGDMDGSDASLTEAGTDGSGGSHSKGGVSGQGAVGCSGSYGGGGGGFFSNGTEAGSNTTPGFGFNAGGLGGGLHGGFGGGGDAGCSGGGGGGGYSGGGAGQGGGGGGSFVASSGYDVEKSVGNESDGKLRIQSVKRPRSAK